MDWKDILTAVVLTIIGSVTIAYSTLYIQNRMAKSRLLKSLLAEVNHNVSLVERHKEQIDQLHGIYAPEGLKELQIDAYYKIRERGYISDMPRELGARMFAIYDTIEGVRRGRYDYVAEPLAPQFITQPTTLSPYRIDPKKPAIKPLLTDLPQLESGLKSFLRIKSTPSSSSQNTAAK